MDCITIRKASDVLLVEDNDADARLAKETMNGSQLIKKLHRVTDGEEALDFLKQKGKYEKSPKPDLIILDLNLPRKSGREVLAEIKQDNDLKRIPVVVLTISENDRDILDVYNLNANCYVVKPIDLDEFAQVIKIIEDFWFKVVKLPSVGNYCKQ